MTSMSIDPIEHVLKKYYRSYNCQSLSISVWYLGTSAYVPRGPRPLPQRFEVPTPHSEIRVSQYQVPMILRVWSLYCIASWQDMLGSDVVGKGGQRLWQTPQALHGTTNQFYVQIWWNLHPLRTYPSAPNTLGSRVFRPQTTTPQSQKVFGAVGLWKSP